ncbi:MAG TPA: 30S ribosomal protein S6 [Spirochaetales bacterium]|nr:30S ribosomal protein S6 [Spirochaetales bacterium]HPG86207.1 30S ribosomal protein S6 [Spirochaetales bacterium]HPM71386.1 30S ribosomal protein S6 [Spirochaetales bacterium]
MRSYELTVIFPTEEELYRQAKEKVSAALKEQGAEIVKEEELGDRQLAYEIKDRMRGRYVLYVATIAPDKIVAVEKVLKLEPNVMKYLFVRAED